MGECKGESIQTNLRTFTHNQTYPGIIQAYLETSVTLMYFITVVYLEPKHIQNQKHIQNIALFRTLAYSKFEACSESCRTSTMKR